MVKEDVFGRDGGVSLQFEGPMTVTGLPGGESIRGLFDHLLYGVFFGPFRRL